LQFVDRFYAQMVVTSKQMINLNIELKLQQ